MSENTLSENCATDDEKDCTLDVKVRLAEPMGKDNWSYFPVFEQGSCDPPTDNVIVDLDGNIDLTQIPKQAGYSKNVDITFILYPDIWFEGEKLPVRWNEDPEDALKLTPKNVKMTPERVNDTTLVLNDRAADGKSYNYKLGVVIGYLIADSRTVDPKIINKND